MDFEWLTLKKERKAADAKEKGLLLTELWNRLTNCLLPYWSLLIN